MTEILAVFRSRSQAADCNSRLRTFNIPATLVATPKECNVGCGLSIKVSSEAYTRARQIILRGGYTAFYGFYKMQSEYGRVVIYRLNN